MPFKPLFGLIILLAVSCNNNAQYSKKVNNSLFPGGNMNSTVNHFVHINDIPLPEGYKRLGTYSDPFACFLRNIELKKDRTVYLFNGLPKRNQRAQFAVLNISVGNKDLQQCA